MLGLGWSVASPGRFGCVRSLVSSSGFLGVVRPPPHRRRFRWSAFRGVRSLLFPSLSGLALVVARVGGVFVSFSSLLRPPPPLVFGVACCCSSNVKRTPNLVPTKALPVVLVVLLGAVFSPSPCFLPPPPSLLLLLSFFGCLWLLPGGPFVGVGWSSLHLHVHPSSNVTRSV